jgi:hypothetical protein
MEESAGVLSSIAQRTRLKKLLMIGAVGTGAALVAKRLASSSTATISGGCQSDVPQHHRSGRTRSASCKCSKSSALLPGLIRCLSAPGQATCTRPNIH